MIVNEVIYSFFQIQSGLLQGYHLSPYLFIIVNKFLSQGLDKLHPSLRYLQLLPLMFPSKALLMILLSLKISTDLVFKAF